MMNFSTIVEYLKVVI